MSSMFGPSNLVRISATLVGIGWVVFVLRKRAGATQASAIGLRARGLVVTLASGLVMWLALMFLPEWTWYLPGAGIAAGLLMGLVASYRIGSGDQD